MAGDRAATTGNTPRMFQGQSQRALPSHARAQQADRRRPNSPPLGHVRRRRDPARNARPTAAASNSEQILSVHQLRPVSRPDHSQTVAVQFGSEGRLIGQSLQAGAVQIENRRSPGRGPPAGSNTSHACPATCCSARFPNLPSNAMGCCDCRADWAASECWRRRVVRRPASARCARVASRRPRGLTYHKRPNRKRPTRQSLGPAFHPGHRAQ